MISQFSIIIPTWNNLPYLKLCIESIRKNSYQKHQIIVYANEGIDGTIEWIKNQRDIEFLSSEKNAGICVAVNSCRALVKAPYIVYMNDDMYVCPNWDWELHKSIEEIGHDRFMLSSTLIEPRAVKNSNYISIVKDFGDNTNSFREDDLLKSYNELHKNDWCGASWPPSVVSTRVWDIVGGYSIEFSPGMYSDPDFSMKLWKYGVRIFKGIGKSKVYHFQSKSTGKVKKNNGNEMFLFKWSISAKVFYIYFLQMGKDYHGPLKDNVKIPFNKRLGNTLKRTYRNLVFNSSL
ncbi:glycosyltransferase family 2 protein [Chryseosolibacter indicus]|nr:glycosyltransferase [Chryseosolibacter indicus]